MKTFQELREEWAPLMEGVYDKGIFKAFFLAGGPGSGKSYVTAKSTGGLGLKIINSDDQFERGLKKANLGFDLASMGEKEFEKAMEVRGRAKELTAMKQQLAINGRLGLVVDGTGREYSKIKKQSDLLRDLGYDTYMVFVNTSLDTALKRNNMRPRKLPEDIVTQSWKDVQSNMGKFQSYFGADKFIVVDNNNATEDILLQVFKRIMRLVNRPIDNYRAKQWIEKELAAKRR